MPSLLTPSERRTFDAQFDAVRQMPPPIPEAERYRVSIEEVGVGGYVRFEGQSYRVTGLNAYEREGARWPELILYRLSDGSTQFLEWEKEDEVSVYVSRQKLSFAEVGLRGKEHLWQISERESGEVRHDGRTFRFHEDSAVTFFRDAGQEGRPFHQYLFKNPSRREYIGVEEWGDDKTGYEHNVILSEYLDPQAIEVLVRGEPTEGPQ